MQLENVSLPHDGMKLLSGIQSHILVLELWLFEFGTFLAVFILAFSIFAVWARASLFRRFTDTNVCRKPISLNCGQLATIVDIRISRTVYTVGY